MKGVKRPLGYTIVEVMVVLAVSGVMFLIAASFINGKQATTSFQQGVNEMASRLQGVIEDVTDGHYSDVPFTCTQNAGGDLQIVSGTAKQGTNSPCVFLGKMIHFSLPGNPTNTQYEILSLAGARQTTGGGIVTDLSTANVREIPFLTTQQTVPQSLQIDGMDIFASGPQDKNFAIGFIQGLGSANGQYYASGAQTVRMVYAPVSANHDVITSIRTLTNDAQKVTICLTDGTRFAHFTIGGLASDATDNSSQLAVNTSLADSGNVCKPLP